MMNITPNFTTAAGLVGVCVPETRHVSLLGEWLPVSLALSCKLVDDIVRRQCITFDGLGYVFCLFIVY